MWHIGAAAGGGQETYVACNVATAERAADEKKSTYI
jgi:hypothetical protein